jgi:type II secretory pathway component PulK
MKRLKNQKGVAMMMALVTFLVLSILVGELAYETGVYNGVVWRQADQLKARLIARSGLRLALLQVRAAEKAAQKAQSMGLQNPALTEQIWKTPLVLPPPPVPGLGVAETQALDAFVKSLDLDGTLTVTITGENSRINLNQMVWLRQGQTPQPNPNPSPNPNPGPNPGPNPNPNPSPNPMSPEERAKQLESARRAVAQVIDQLLESKRRTDDQFRDRYGIVTGEVLAGNLLAWMSPDVQVDGDNREKFDYYSRFEPTPYSLKNAPLATESELFMIKGFDDTLARLISDNFTTQPTAGLNVNDASELLLRALIPELGDFEIERILQRRTDQTLGGPFKSADDFWGFLNTFGDFAEAKKRLQEQGIGILEKESSFRVVVTAQSGSASKTWVAQLGPLPPAVDPPTPQQPTQPGPQPPPNPGGPESPNPPRNNDSNSLNIIYLKAD